MGLQLKCNSLFSSFLSNLHIIIENSSFVLNERLSVENAGIRDQREGEVIDSLCHLQVPVIQSPFRSALHKPTRKALRVYPIRIKLANKDN